MPPEPDVVRAFDVHEALMFLRRRKWSVLAGLVPFLVAAALYSHYASPSYHSDVTFLVEAAGSTEGVGGLDILSQLGRGRQIETEIELIRSRRVLNPVIDSLLLSVRPVHGAARDSQRVVLRAGDQLADGEHVLVRGDLEVSVIVGPDSSRRNVFDIALNRHQVEGVVLSVKPGPAVRGSTTEGEGPLLVAFTDDSIAVDLPTELGDELVEHAAWNSEALEDIGLRLGVGRVQRDADLIRLRCEGRSPQAARGLCSAIEASYLSVRQDLERAHAATTRQLLAEQLARVSGQLQEAEDNLTAFSRRNRVVALEDRASEEVRQQADLQARRDLLESERSALATILGRVGTGDRFLLRDLAAFPSFLGNETVTDLMASLLDLEDRRSELAVTRTDESRDIRAIDSRIESIERQLHSMAISYEQSLAAQVDALDETVAGMGARLATIPDQRIEHARLEREAENLGEVYALLESRMQEARIAESVNLPTVRVVDSATFPAKPTSPKAPLNLALGTLAGLAFGLGLAFLREQLDPGLRGWRQVEQQTGLSVLSMVPQVDRPGPVLECSVLQPASAGSSIVRAGTADSLRLRRAAEKAISLEAYRSLAVDLNFAARDGNGGGSGRGFRSLAVTSGTRGEGKTLTACNLAIVHAASGHRTLLVDGDVRAAGVSKFFGFGQNEPGLTDVLGDRRYAPWSVRHEAQVEGGHKLSLMLSGPPTRNTASLFEGAAFEKLLRDFDREYDLVIFDTPPLSVITDAAAVAASVEAVLLVVRSGVTERETLDFTLQRIRRLNANLLGVVLNGVRRGESYGSRYEYAQDEVYQRSQT